MAKAQPIPLISVIVPTYKEVANLPHLIDRLAQVKDQCGLNVEMLIVDDDSGDGSEELVSARPESWVRIIVRKADRGLSAAVLEGARQAEGQVLVCMDADMSHPPEAIPEMVRKLEDGADFVVGSRYVAGGATADDWGFLRWLNSRIATMLARPLTDIKDPMAGFFALRRDTFSAGRNFNPIGYKIGLELLVKCHCERAVEIPIVFENRRYGQSKLTFRQQLLYLQHLRRLYIYKFGVWSQFAQFAVVGAVGAIVNLVFLRLLIAGGMSIRWAAALAIMISMTSNFVFNRRFSFSFARTGNWFAQYIRFIAASSAGAVVNYVVTLQSLARFPNLRPELAASVGILAGLGFNFVSSRYLVFRARHVRSDRTRSNKEVS